MISWNDYFQSRDKQYPGEMTGAIAENAATTIQRANKLLEVFGEERGVNSGWRPPAVNASTPGAALFSKHMLAQAIDLSDPHGDLDDWCMSNFDLLESIGLWLEHPSATKGWCHVQTVPPKSGRRAFYP